MARSININESKLIKLVGKIVSVDWNPAKIDNNQHYLKTSPAGDFYIEGYFSEPEPADPDGEIRKDMCILLRDGMRIRYPIKAVNYNGLISLRVMCRTIKLDKK